MTMSTALVNGTEAENNGQDFTISEMVGSNFEPSRSPGADFEKITRRELKEITPEEFSNMKQLMISNLDYIQLQSEQLTKKDKQIEELKTENESLKQRLARMERRVSLQKARGEKKQMLQATSSRLSSTDQQAPSESGLKRRRTIDQAHSSSHHPITRRSLASDAQPQTSNKRIRPSDRAQNQPKSLSDENGNENEPPVILDDILTSRIAYHTLVGEKHNFISRYLRRTKRLKPGGNHHNIEVRYSLNPLSPMYTMEGTEPLSDDVFERRHFKLTCDEKKRKRWDVQRILTQRQLEKLKLQEGGDKSHERQVQSLWPEPNENLKVSVTSSLPVAVFGINLPSAKIQDFSLPWKEGIRIITSRRRIKR